MATDAIAGQVLAWNEDGLLCVAELPIAMTAGLAVRDLKKGEIVDYDPEGNTRDIFTGAAPLICPGRKKKRR